MSKEDSTKKQNANAPNAATSLRLDWCSWDAAKFAVEKWHYSRNIPPQKCAKVGVWENGKYVGVVIFGIGATHDLVKPYGLTPVQGCELTRVALSNHASPVSKIIAIALKMLKKAMPGLRLIVSFADPNEGHHGGIYQAGGWVYTGRSEGCHFFKHKKTGKVYHPRNVSEDLTLQAKVVKPSECEKVWKEGKHRYLMPLDAEMRQKIETLRKPYPKRAGSVDSGTPEVHSGGGGAIPTSALREDNGTTD